MICANVHGRTHTDGNLRQGHDTLLKDLHKMVVLHSFELWGQVGFVGRFCP